MRILVYSPSLNDVSIFYYQSITPPLPSLSYAVFGLPPSIVSLALGDLGVEEVAQLNSKVRNELTESNASRLISNSLRFRITSFLVSLSARNAAISRSPCL